MHEESQSVDWIIHDVDDHLHNIWFFKISVLILEGAEAMSDGLDFIDKIYDDFS